MNSLEMIWILFTYITVLLVLIFCFDDLYIDFIALVKGLKPEKINDDDLAHLHNTTQKRIAVMIANWQEGDIIERMIHGNVGRIDYLNYDFFLGVYPNDIETVQAAKKLQDFYSHVHIVTNTKPGPTSKGQMLNEITHHIRAKEITDRSMYEVFLMHDSEDIIHPLSLKLINYKMNENDFLQTPVFSLPADWRDLTRGIYIDEFTESHTKDMLVRSHLKGGVPSAGVGTAMSRLFVSEILTLQNNQLLKEDTLTEDYHLGLMAQRLGYHSEFICCYVQRKNRIDYIATREYFPANIKTSIRQKTRWTLGISFQGYANLKWSETLIENYFLWRDRRSFLNTFVLIFSYLLTASYLVFHITTGKWPNFLSHHVMLVAAFNITFGCLAIRFIQRVRLVQQLNGFKLSLFIPIRWFLANYINGVASLKAFATYRRSLKTGERPQWVKTVHELPISFGLEPELNLQNNQTTEINLERNII